MVATVRTLPRVNAEEKSFIRFVVEESPNVLENPSKGYRQRGLDLSKSKSTFRNSLRRVKS